MFAPFLRPHCTIGWNALQAEVMGERPHHLHTLMLTGTGGLRVQGSGIDELRMNLRFFSGTGVKFRAKTVDL